MEHSANIPSAEKILSTLIDLYADQCGVKVDYQIEESGEKHVPIY